jgi:lysyl endopeptidase
MAPSRIFLFFVSGLLAFAFSQQASAVKVKGESVKVTAKAAPITLRSSNYPVEATARLGLKDLAIERIIDMQKANKRNANFKALQIGIGRSVEAEGLLKELPVLKWQVLKTGKVTRLEVGSPDALSTRIGLRIGVLDNRAELRFFGSGNPQKIEAVVSAVSAKRLIDENGLYWTPVTEGEKQTVEIFLPLDAPARDVRITAVSVMHLLVSAKDNFSLEKALGSSGACETNVVCSVGALGQNFVNAKNAVARMIFVVGTQGLTCTGTLVNDNVAATQIPYFVSANHCISTQTSANTLTTIWNEESSVCSPSNGGSPTQVSGGATLLYSQSGGGVGSDSGTDFAFFRLNNNPPAGAFFAGWDSSGLASNTAVTAIHHPQGDVKKVSQGNKYSSGNNTHFVSWNNGTTEQGSSGSGLFTSDASGYYLRGGLFGGNASCANTGGTPASGNTDIYSRFDIAYPNLTAWLAPAAVNGPTVNHTGPWYNPAEGGWGVTWFEYPSNGILGLMFIYDGAGRADWYEFTGNWTGSDVHSGNILRDSGPPFSTTFNSASVSKVIVGTYTLTFTSATTATFTYSITNGGNTVTRTNVPFIKL